MITEINFDGLIGPSHNYAALSFGNLASASNVGTESRPRAAALQGLQKMSFCLSLGLHQGLLPPLERPDARFLRAMGFAGDDAKACAAAWAADPELLARATSASSMWTANAATVSPAADSADGRTHLSVANLSRMAHRSIEHPDTARALRLAFGHPAFAVHDAVPAAFGDEGAANHMRLCADHEAPGVEIFVYGEEGGRFPARQHRRASEAVARRHGLDPARLKAELARIMPEAIVIEVPAAAVSLAEAIKTYLFNSQLVTMADGTMALILPKESEESPAVKGWLDALVAGNGPIRAVHYVDVRESMRNGGGPACLRLRVVADPTTVDPRFLLDPGKIERLAKVVERHWPDRIGAGDLSDPALWDQCWQARCALYNALDLQELL